MSKHTPGPWSVVPDIRVEGKKAEYIAGFDIVGPDDIAVVGCEGIAGDVNKDRPNAILIAAAPDLLTALEVLFADYKELADSGDAGLWRIEDLDSGKQALAAIAKAKGE